LRNEDQHGSPFPNRLASTAELAMSAAGQAQALPAPAGSTFGDSAAAVRSRRLLLISVLLAAAGAGLLALYLHSFETEVSGGERVQLLAVIKPIPRGSVLQNDMLGIREVPVSYVEQRAVKAAELSKVRGVRTAIDLDPQDSLLWTDLAIAVEDRDLSSLVQPGNRAFTIETRRNGSSASSTEMIRPGDYVDVLATFSGNGSSTATRATKVLLQRVLVLAVGNETQRQAFQGTTEKGAPKRSSMLTLSLKLDEAQMVAEASEEGDLSVVLRGASDPTVLEGLPDVTPQNLVEAAMKANRNRNTQNTTTSTMPVRIGSDGR
jgi:pilus assembly protein CpaB